MITTITRVLRSLLCAITSYRATRNLKTHHRHHRATTNRLQITAGAVRTVRNGRRNLLISSAVLVGLISEMYVNEYLHPRLDHFEYYTFMALTLHLLAVYLFVILRKVGGSLRIFTLMTFLFCAIVFNVLMLDPSTYWQLKAFRSDYFAPLYRLTEMLILLSCGREILSCVLLLITGIVRRTYVMVTGRYIYF